MPVLLLAQDYRVVSVNHDGTAFSFETTYRQIGSPQSARAKLFWFDSSGPSLLADDGGAPRSLSADGTVTLIDRGGLGTIVTPTGRIEYTGKAAISRNGRFALILRDNGSACRLHLATAAEQCFAAEVPPWIAAGRIGDNGSLLLRTRGKWRIHELGRDARTVRSLRECAYAILEPAGTAMLCGNAGNGPVQWSAIDLATGAPAFVFPEGDAVFAVATSNGGERWAMFVERSGFLYLVLQWCDRRDRFEIPLDFVPTGLEISGNGGVVYYSTERGIWSVDWHTRDRRAVLEAPRGASLTDGWPVPGGWIYTPGLDQPPPNAVLWVGNRLAARIRGSVRHGWQIPWESADDGPGMPIVLRFGDPYFEAAGGVTIGPLHPEANVVLASGGRNYVPLSYAWHDDGLTPVTASSPAKPGEVVSMWWRGLGPVNPVPAAGELAPFEPPARVVAPLRVRDFVTGRELEVGSAILRPGFVGEYLVAIRVPVGFAGPLLNAELTVEGIAARCGPIQVRGE